MESASLCNNVPILGCEVHGYDPTVDYTSSHVGFNFQPLGIGIQPKNSSQKYFSFKKFLEMNNHTDRKITFLKMDVEGAEIEVLETALRDKSLTNVQQISLEYHLTNQYAPGKGKH